MKTDVLGKTPATMNKELLSAQGVELSRKIDAEFRNCRLIAHPLGFYTHVTWVFTKGTFDVDWHRAIAAEAGRQWVARYRRGRQTYGDCSFVEARAERRADNGKRSSTLPQTCAIEIVVEFLHGAQQLPLF